MTAPPRPADERTLQATGACRRRAGTPTPSELVARLRSLNAGTEAFVALFDARAVAGERHLLSAWAHLSRARARREYRLRDRSAEFALYVAGDDQLPRALAKVGFGPTTEEFVLVTERPRAPGEVLEALGLRAEPSIYPRAPDAVALDRLGIGKEEREAAGAAAWEGLVLERVAFVDLTPARSLPEDNSTKD